jgi:hypothetical protein
VTQPEAWPENVKNWRRLRSTKTGSSKRGRTRETGFKSSPNAEMNWENSVRG